MASPNDVAPTVTPIVTTYTLSGDVVIPFFILRVDLDELTYTNSAINPNNNLIGTVVANEEVELREHDEPVNNLIIKDFFGKENATPIEALDFFKRLDGQEIDIAEIGFDYPDINSFLWFDPYIEFFGNEVENVYPDFFSAGIAVTLEDFFTALDEVNCKLGSTVWDRNVGFTMWDVGLTCWDVPI